MVLLVKMASNIKYNCAAHFAYHDAKLKLQKEIYEYTLQRKELLAKIAHARTELSALNKSQMSAKQLDSLKKGRIAAKKKVKSVSQKTTTTHK